MQDSELYKLYGELINFNYPLFLNQLGLDSTAIKAEGAIITDSLGKTYIDCVGGYGLFNIGHNHPKMIQDMISQLNNKQLFSKPFITEIQVKLAQMISEIVPGDLSCSYICNSGSEAIDSAIKLARLQRRKKIIITADNSFHGYTFGALSVSGISSFKRSFGPMVPGIIHVPFGNIEALLKSISSDTAAVLLEPIQHEAGVEIPPPDYFFHVRRICDDRDIIFILDEIKTCFGKLGWMFACEEFNIIPDILVVGKSLGGGMIPIGALIAKRNLWKKFSMSFPMSASSFAGNTLACRAALSTVEILQKNGLLIECQEKGSFLLNELEKVVKRYPDILKNVKGKGLLLGLKTVSAEKAFRLSKEMIRQGVIVMPAFGNPSVIMIEPPIIITFKQIQDVLRRFRKACKRLGTTSRG